MSPVPYLRIVSSKRMLRGWCRATDMAGDPGVPKGWLREKLSSFSLAKMRQSQILQFLLEQGLFSHICQIPSRAETENWYSTSLCRGLFRCWKTDFLTSGTASASPISSWNYKLELNWDCWYSKKGTDPEF